jgi:hypothetical protein
MMGLSEGSSLARQRGGAPEDRGAVVGLGEGDCR